MDEPTSDSASEVRRRLSDGFGDQATALALLVLVNVLVVAMALRGAWPSGIGKWIGASVVFVLASIPTFAALRGAWPSGIGKWIGAAIVLAFATIPTLGLAMILSYFVGPYLARRWLRENHSPARWFRSWG
jgi:hypothetical protein